MRHLVREDLGDVLRGPRPTRPGVGEQQRLAIEDRAGVLHRARCEVRHGDDVELLERILDRVVAVVVLDDLAASTRARTPVSPFLSGVEQTRIGMPSAPPAMHSKSPTASATRYVDIFGVVSNCDACACLRRDPGVSETTAPFEIAVSPLSMMAVSANVALKAGSSNDGNMRRASVASSW